jgi:hypothetical protein
MATWLGVNQHQAGYRIDLVNTKAPLGQNGYKKALTNPQRCDSKVDTNHGVHLAEVNDMQTLFRKVKQGFETNKEGLLIHSLREAVSFRAKM